MWATPLATPQRLRLFWPCLRSLRRGPRRLLPGREERFVSEQGSSRDFDDFARRLIRRKARQLVGRAGLRFQDVPDIEHEIAVRLLQGLRWFDPNRAPRDPFVTHLVSNA